MCLRRRQERRKILWKMTGSGHVWPGKDAKVERILGKPNHLIDANEEMWAFFRNFTRAAPSAH